jgi:hypothetical protein
VQDKLRKDFELWLREFQEVSKLSVAKGICFVVLMPEIRYLKPLRLILERESNPRPSDDTSVFRGLGSQGLTADTPGGTFYSAK